MMRRRQHRTIVRKELAQVMRDILACRLAGVNGRMALQARLLERWAVAEGHLSDEERNAARIFAGDLFDILSFLEGRLTLDQMMIRTRVQRTAEDEAAENEIDTMLGRNEAQQAP